MRVAHFLLPFILAALFLVPSGAQQSSPPSAGSQPVQRDPQALTILNQALQMAGGADAVRAIETFTGSGTITYFEPSNEVKGSVTVRGKGLDQFRLDATLPTGARSWAVSNGSGSARETDGVVTSIPYHNAVDFGSLTFPLAYVMAALRDPATNIHYLGLATVDGRQAHQIRLEPFATEGDPGNMISKLNSKNFFIDPTTFQVFGVLDMMHPENNSALDFPHELEFSDYRVIEGLLVPFSITEKIGDRRAWTIQLAQVAFNNALSDAVFQL